MHDATTAIAVVLARGGSVRLPRKNLRELNGKPLLAYPIELCRSCEWIGPVLVSTDDDAIMRVAQEHGAEVPFRRPADISTDVPSELVTEHALRFLLERDGALPAFTVTVTPATPLTPPKRLDEAYRLLLSHPEWDAVTAVRAATEHPEWAVRLDRSGEGRTVLGNPLNGEVTVSQNLRPAHYPSGAFWINRTDAFLRRPSLYGERWGAVVLDPEEAVDIDVSADLARAEKLARPR